MVYTIYDLWQHWLQVAVAESTCVVMCSTTIWFVHAHALYFSSLVSFLSDYMYNTL